MIDRIWIGETEIAATTDFSLNVERDYLDPAPNGLLYRRGLRQTTASFEMTETDAAAVLNAAADPNRDITFVLDEPLTWSRWRRWLNGFLRFMWWPLGPPRLPTSHELTVHLEGMRLRRLNREHGHIRVELSTKMEGES
jgi:hypothetical protein